MQLTIRDPATGEERTAKVLRLAGVHLVCQFKRSSADKKSGEQTVTGLVGAYNATDQERFWECYRALGGGTFFFEDGTPFE